MSLEGRHTSYVHLLPPEWSHWLKLFSEDEQISNRKQDVRFDKNREPTEAERARRSRQKNIMFVGEDDPAERQHTVAAFKIFTDGETLTKQQRILNNIDAFNKKQVKPKVSVRMNLDFPTTRKALKVKTGGKKSASKMVVAELGKRVQKYDFIRNIEL